MVMEFF